MITVTLLTDQSGIKTQVGSIDFDGVRIKQPDGSFRIPMRDGKEVPFSYHCNPTPQLSSDDLEQFALKIAEELSRNVVMGIVNNYEWRAHFSD